MKQSHQSTESDPCNELPAREPFFRRHQTKIKIKAGVRAGAVPTGHPPIGY